MYDLFSDFFDAFDMFAQPTYSKEKKCPVCGRTYYEFTKTGKFGCGECYKTFRNSAASVLKQVHSTTKHTGKIPSKSGDALKKQRKYDNLKAQLQEAVKNENYELAAKLHKEIRAMENDLK
jgi:protein arginine kinase activator